ncbi:hypothetical protein [Paraburkholderia fungorum]|uniref:hypothetical protein n=1 Tax=Paraburkholderia fungorum TaxID=134537 RepID=UPI00160932B3|nr:hypothetical protein [Paraburkholderia fungorum]MBB5546607.1 hypothetical protein [Paraburkholderia fungorum]
MRLQEQLVVLQALNTGLSGGATFDHCFAVVEELNVGELADEWRKIRGLIANGSSTWVKNLVSTMDPHVRVLVEAGVSLRSGVIELKPAIALLHSMLRHEGQRSSATHLKDQVVALEVLDLCEATGRHYADGAEILADQNVGGHQREWREIAAMLRTDGAKNWKQHFAALLEPEVGMLFRVCVELASHRHDFAAALSYLHILVQRDAGQRNAALGNLMLGQAVSDTASA